MATAQNQKRLSNVRYWRYVFTPLLLLVVVFGLYLLFTMPDTQTTDYRRAMAKAEELITSSAMGAPVAIAIPSAPASNALNSLRLNPSAIVESLRSMRL